MLDPGGITEVSRANEGNGSRHRGEIDSSPGSSVWPKRSRYRRNSGGSPGPSQSSRVPQERREEQESVGKSIQQEADDQKRDRLSTDQEGHRAQFYERYRKVAWEYDKEFLKKHEDDLKTTLIFAGLFSAVTSAFIVAVDSQLRPDPGDETAALLRVLIYKIDNTTFGDEVPALPKWAGPPHTMVHVQAILFASLFASLFSAFLAMLGKQWLNRYESTDMRGSAIERSKNRQQKLDGIDAWYFVTVMESLPLMLQAALLLLGCALSLYLWGIDSTIAWVVIGMTSFGAIFYIFIIIAGAITGSCPYQTPGSKFLRYLGPIFWRMLASALRNTFKETIETIRDNRRWLRKGGVTRFLRGLVSEVPPAIAADARRLLLAVIRTLAALSARVYHLLRVQNRLRGSFPLPERRSTWHAAVLDLRCILWALQTSLNKTVHLSAFKYLMFVLELAEFDPALVVVCFNIFVGGISVNDGRVAIKEGLEQLAAVSAGCFCRTFYRLTATDPTSNILEDMRRRYRRVFPDGIDFTGLPSRPSMIMIDALIRRDWGRHPIWRDGERPSDHEHIAFAHDIAELGQAEFRREREVSEWILTFAFDSLSLAPLPPTSIVADCFKIVAIDLGCDVSDVMTSDEDAKVERVSTFIAQELETMAEDNNQALGPPLGLTLDPALVVTRFYIFAVCIRFGNQRVAFAQGLEELATASAGRFYRTLHRLTVAAPTSSVLEVIRQCYHRAFPDRIDFTGLPSRHTMTMTDALIRREWSRNPIWRDDDRPSDHEHTSFARDIAELAEVEYRPERGVPGWILAFAFDSLSLDPLPPASIVIDCLKVIAIDLGCKVSDIATSDERAKVAGVSILITRKLETMVEGGDRALDSALAVNCFIIFTVCTNVGNRRVAVTQGLEQLATVSARCIYRIFRRLTVTDPTSSVLEDIRERYRKAFRDVADFTGFPYCHTMIMVHALISRDWDPRPMWCGTDRPSDREHIQFARDIAELAQAEYLREQKVPQWILGFAFHSLALSPLPPGSIVPDCLEAIAVHFGCDVSGVVASDESAKVEEVSTLITRKLETMVEGDGDRALDSNLVVNFFNVLTVCVTVGNGRAAITQGLEHLATVSARYLYHIFRHLTVMDPTSSILGYMRPSYRRVFPDVVDFTGLPCCHTMIMIHALIRRNWGSRPIWRDDDRPSDHEYITFARDVAELAQAEYQRKQKVPEWVLGFAFDSLSLDPLPPAPIVGDCLKAIATDLGCDVSDVVTSDESVPAHVELVSGFITQELETAVEAGDQLLIVRKCEAICAVLPYAISLDRDGQQGMANAITHAVRASKDRSFMSFIASHITLLFGRPSSPFLDWLITVVSPHINWADTVHGESTVVGWATAALTVPDTEEVIQSVIVTLLQVANFASLRPHIPIEIWTWMEKEQSLPLMYCGRRWRTTPDVVRHIRGLGDLKILKSYFLLVWSKLYYPHADILNEMEISIREKFGGVGMRGHRKDLVNGLEHILEILATELEHGNQVGCIVRARQYGKLKELLLDMDREATRPHSTFMCALPLQCL